MAMRAIFGGRLKSQVSSQSLNSLEEAQMLEDALRAVTLIMNDDVEGAEAGLAKGNSPFHKVRSSVLFSEYITTFFFLPGKRAFLLTV